MSTAGLPTIRELVEEAAGSLPEPFTRAALINWVSARRPDVGRSSIAAHIQFATDNAASGSHAAADPFAGRTPALHRVGRGLYLRYRPPASAGGAGELPAAGRVVLIGSSGGMAAAPGPAGEVFESPGFARARAYAERSGRPWFVLSARHGLLDADEMVSPYDVALGDQSAAYRSAWGEWVVAQLAERLRLAGGVVEVHGGVDFAQPLRQPLARRGAGLEIPLPGAWRERDAAAGEGPGEPPGDAAPEVRDDVDPGERDGGTHDSPGRAALGRLRHLVSRGAHG